MTRQWRAMPTVFALLTALAVLASSCGNSPSNETGTNADNQASTNADNVDTPTTEATADPDGADNEAPNTGEGGDGTEGDDNGGNTDGTGDDDTPTDPDDTPNGTEDDDQSDPYPNRHDFVALEGVPGVSDEEISVAVIGTQQGNPLGTCILDCYVTGIQSYFDYVNSRDGVYGRQLVVGEVLDDGLFANQSHSLKVISDNDSLAVFGATLVASGWGDLNDAGIPTFVWNIHSPESVDRNAIFGNIAIGCPTCTNRWLPWIVSQSGSSKVAVLAHGISENSKVCGGSFRDSIELYGDILGLEVVYFNDDIAFGLPNGIGPEVTQIINEGADFIASCMDLNSMLTLAQELKRQGVRDQIAMYHPNSYDTEFVATAGELFEGDYVAPQFAAFEYEVDTELRHAYDEWVPTSTKPVSELTMIGWINADLFVTGLLEAGPSFNRQLIIDSLNKTIYGAGGLINPIDWSRQHNAVTAGSNENDYAQECASVVRIEGGKFVGFQPAPWMCWSGDSQEWSEPVPTNLT